MPRDALGKPQHNVRASGVNVHSPLKPTKDRQETTRFRQNQFWREILAVNQGSMTEDHRSAKTSFGVKSDGACGLGRAGVAVMLTFGL